MELTYEEYHELAFDPRQYDEHDDDDERNRSSAFRVIKKGEPYEWQYSGREESSADE